MKGLRNDLIYALVQLPTNIQVSNLEMRDGYALALDMEEYVEELVSWTDLYALVCPMGHRSNVSHILKSSTYPTLTLS